MGFSRMLNFIVFFSPAAFPNELVYPSRQKAAGPEAARQPKKKLHSWDVAFMLVRCVFSLHTSCCVI